jgi:hypothetical protein
MGPLASALVSGLPLDRESWLKGAIFTMPQTATTAVQITVTQGGLLALAWIVGGWRTALALFIGMAVGGLLFVGAWFWFNSWRLAA